MAANKRAVELSEDIKLVLGALNMRYPNYVPGESIFRAVLGVSTDYTKVRLRRDMTYLNDKGYVRFKGLHGIDAMAITVNDCAFALTAAGFELANSLTADPAIGPMHETE